MERLERIALSTVGLRPVSIWGSASTLDTMQHHRADESRRVVNA